MRRECNACSVDTRFYSLYITEQHDFYSAYLQNYLQQFPGSSSFYEAENIIWLEESMFFNFIDYAVDHLPVEHLLAADGKVKSYLEATESFQPLDHFQAQRETMWIDRIIVEEAICTHYQPIVAVDRNGIRVVGQELLSRGIDEDGQIIPPFRMFEAARKRNRLFALDRVCRLSSIRNAHMLKDQLVFINFLPTSIYTPEHCLATTFALVQQLNMKPEQIVFEVVETEKYPDLEHLKRILTYYQQHGFRYALDDVGVGYNGLWELIQLKPDIVKLAIEFTNGVSKDQEKEHVAQSVLAMAHEMNALALAEGVETEEDWRFLADMGYDLFQGYYFAKPQPEPMTQLQL